MCTESPHLIINDYVFWYSRKRFEYCWRLNNRRWISANNCDLFIAFYLKTRMESDNDVIGEHTGVGLQKFHISHLNCILQRN